MKVSLSIAAFVAVCGFFASAMAQTVSHTTPLAVAPGQTSELLFHGDKLAGAKTLWLSFAGTAEASPDNNPKDAAKVKFRIVVPAEVAPGIYAARLSTDKGVSNARLIMVDDLPTIAEQATNKSANSAQELNLPVAVDGACEAESLDHYKFTASKGQRVSVEAVARRLGSPLDPVVRVFDAQGRELAYSDDDPGVGVDSRLALTIPADGLYVIQVRDIQFAGGANHRYRLRVGDFPLITAAYPLAVRKGASATLSMAGSSVEGLVPQSVQVPESLVHGTLAVAAKFPNGHGSGLARLSVEDLPEALETEPNNKLEEATPGAVPSLLNGRLQAPRDRDFYRLDVKKGQRLQFTGITRALGSPSYLFLQLYDAAGKKLAEAEDPGTDEVRLNHTFAADGSYLLMVEELTYGGGSQHVYGIRVEEYKPGFSLALDADQFNPPKSGVFVTKVTAVRRDYSGPITLELVGAGEGYKLANNVIAEGKNDTTMSVTLPADLDTGRLVVCQVVGKAKVGDHEVQAVAAATAAVQKQYPGMASYPPEITQSLALGVGPVFPQFFKLKTEPEVVLLPQLVGTNTFAVKVEKLNKFDDAIALKVEGLPEGVTAEVKPIEKGKTEAVVTLKGPEALALGEHRFKLTGSATFTNQPQSQTLGEVALKVIKPLVVQAAAAGPIAPGGKQKIKVTVTRFGDHKAPIVLAWKNLPEGIAAPADVAVPEGKNEVEIEVAATAEAAAVKAEQVVVVGSTKVKDQDVVVESAPLVLEIKK